MRTLIIACVLSMIVPVLLAQEIRDKGVFCEYENKYWKHIEQSIEKFESKCKKPEDKRQFKMDFSEREFPTSISDYKVFWHQPSISQGNSGSCWCFSTTSFFESEICRISGKKVKLSEMYTVYWETLEKARRFVQERGNSLFDQGSQASAVIRMWKKYGIVPQEAYTAKREGQEFHNHEHMFEEMKQYLAAVKANHAWNENQVLETIRAIMDHHIGRPPEHVSVEGKKMTPLEYLATLSINLDDYVDLLSLMQEPYYEMVEYKVPDNWWHNRESLNVPLDDFMSVLRNALRDGFTLCLGGDVTEPGHHIWKQVAAVPTFDIPSAYIDEYARQFRFTNNSTTDDHGVHCIGWLEKDGSHWYLIKDSGSGSRNGKEAGYFFYHEDYIKLKMMNIMVHRDAAKKIVEKYQATHPSKNNR